MPIISTANSYRDFTDKEVEQFKLLFFAQFAVGQHDINNLV